jgi:prolyl oligopeptidase
MTPNHRRLGLTAFVGLAQLTAAPAGYAQTVRSHSVEVRHGIAIADPFRWLEAMRTPRVLAWARRQDTRARVFASGWPGRDSIRLSIARAADHDRYLAPVRRDGIYYFARVNSSFTRVSILRQVGLDGSPALVVDAGVEEKRGLAVNRSFSPSPDGAILAYGVMRFGSGWMQLRFRDTRTGRDLPDALEGLRGGRASNVSWAPDGSGVFYDAFTPPSAESRQHAQLTGSRVAFHRVGTRQGKDRVLAGPYVAGIVVSHQLTDDSRWLVATLSDGSHPGNRVDVFETGAGGLRKRELVRDEAAPFSLVGSAGNEIWLYTQAGAPNGRVVAIDVEHPEPAHWREVVAEQPHPIDPWTGIRALGEEIVGGFRENGLLRLRIFRPGQPSGRELPLPRIGSVWFGFTGRQGDPEFFFTLDGFADPGTVYRHDLSAGRTSVFRAPELPYNSDDVITRQVFYSGEAGDSIPMYLAYQKGMEPDGRRPVMIYGYAFGGWSASPWFRPHMAEWFRMGGVFALPALRGGGEFGQAWAEAGIRANRQNAVDDFVAAARWLVAHGLASPQTLVAETNSAGASVVGAAILQRPNLFGAALFGFPLLDLLHYERFTGGAQWRSQLGSVEDRAEFQALMAYSPVQNVRSGLCYPAVLVTPGELDETTPPFHAYKFVAALQRAQSCDAPALLRMSWGAGHSYGRDQATTVSNFADQLAFLRRVLPASGQWGGEGAPGRSTGW